MKILFTEDWLRKTLDRLGDDSECQVGTDKQLEEFMEALKRETKPEGLIREGFFK